MAPDTARTKDMNLIGVVGERPDTEIGKRRERSNAGGGASSMNALIQSSRD